MSLRSRHGRIEIQKDTSGTRRSTTNSLILQTIVRIYFVYIVSEGFCAESDLSEAQYRSECTRDPRVANRTPSRDY